METRHDTRSRTRLAPILDLPAREPALRKALDDLASITDKRGIIAGLSPAAAAVFIPDIVDKAPGRKVILIVPGEKEAEQMHADVSFAAAALRGPGATRVRLFAPLEADPYQGLAPHQGTACDRVLALDDLRSPGETIVIAPTRALIHPLPPPPAFDAYRLDLRAGQEIRPDQVSEFLLAAGYVRVDLASSVGEFSRRGGIIDYYSCAGPAPVRVEFWGEQIESIRTYDPRTQRSAAPLDQGATILPVREYRWDRDALERLRQALEARRARRRAASGTTAAARAAMLHDDLAQRIEELASGRTFDGFEAAVRLVEPAPASLFDYAPDALVLTWEAGQVLSELEAVYVEMHASFDLAEKFGMPPPEELLLRREDLEPRVADAVLRLSELALDQDKAARKMPIVRVPCAPPRAYKGRLQDLASDLKQRPSAARALFLMDTPGRIDRLAEVLREYDLAPAIVRDDALRPGDPPDAGLVIAPGRLSHGFVLAGAGLHVLTEREVFGEHVERETRRKRVAAFSPGFRDLKVGDMVVHVEHGIGRYHGIARVGEEGSQRDFVLLSYEGGDRLYVPIDRLDLVQRYSGTGGREVRLDRLGGPGWERTKKKVRNAMREMAQDLIELYAARRAAPGYAFGPDGPWQKEFEDAFAYEETPDQKKAIEDVKADMERDQPMDRLICGDVGFGKTEVAMRAAFKVVMEGRQVAVLVPTTVLAFQHLNTFRERFSSWPTNIDMLSRFRSPREQRQVLKALAEGKIDILIGTHRILSQDVRFRDLGLLVVDEEQRFGVAHKERIKTLKKNVDVLTLTATPIPRTLQMSLAGIRDMSVIETPPENRLAIQTAIAPFREGVIQQAIRHELKRGGQVYIVHNRIESIASMANLVRRLVPEARLAIGHGQMGERALERTMMSFLAGDYDVLLATTIIENGLDIPRVNTIVVNRADRMGLAQLYQLRGRVGRSDRRAYAWFLVPARTPLTEIARRRLKALQEFTELGSGFRIAAMDLEIRGAGNLLGAQQSGHIAAVGFEMYMQLLDRAVRELKGEAPPPEVRAQINLGVDLKIPDDVVPDFGDRLALYKRIASAAGDDELLRIRDEIADVYGSVPRQADNLIALAGLRLIADRIGVRTIDHGAGRITVRFSDDAPVEPQRLVQMAAHRPGVSLAPGNLLRIEPPAPAGDAARLAAVAEILQALGACVSIPVPSQSSVTGPASGDR